MKKILLVIFLALLASLLLEAQQPAIVPKAGEGRFSRASTAAFWVNSVFLQPSVFVSENRVHLGQPLKWWRDHPKPIEETGWNQATDFHPSTYVKHTLLSDSRPDSLCLRVLQFRTVEEFLEMARPFPPDLPGEK